MVQYDSNVAIFPWVGDRVLDTLVVQLRERDLPVERDGISIVVNDTSADTLPTHLRALAECGPADPVELARTVANKLTEKHHPFLGDELLSIDYASAKLDTEAAWNALVRVVASLDGEVAS